MSLLSQWFTKKYAVPAAEQMQMQMKIQDLQMRMKDARGDQEMMMQMNQEMMVLMKQMYKKQLIPMMLRSLIWIALFGLLQLIFKGYDQYLPFNFIFGRTMFSLYLLVSLSFSIVMILGKLILKANPEKHLEEEKVIDHINALDNNII